MNKIKKFFKDHKNEIILGAGVILITASGIIFYKATKKNLQWSTFTKQLSIITKLDENLLAELTKDRTFEEIKEILIRENKLEREIVGLILAEPEEGVNIIYEMTVRGA